MDFPIPEEPPVIRTTLFMMCDCLIYETSKNKKILPKEDYFCKNIIKKNPIRLGHQINKKMASDLHRTAQPRTLAMFPSWGSLQELVV